MRKIVTLFLATVLLFSIVISPMEKARAEETIKLGVNENFTGPIAFLGPLHKKGIQMALEEVKYTVSGRKIELIVEDCAGDMNVALEKSKKLVEWDKAHIIIGPIMSDAQVAIAPYLANKKVVCTTLYAAPLELAKYRNWLIYPTTLIGVTYPLGQYAAALGYKTMVTIGADYAGGHGYIEGIKLGFEGKGGKVIQQIWKPVGITDYGPYLSSIKKADCVGFFMEGTLPAQRLISQYHQFGTKMPLLMTNVAAELVPSVLSELGDTALGIRGETCYFPERKDSLNEKWVKDMTKRFGEVPGAFEANAYALTRAILAGLEATGGDDSFDKLWPAILKLKIKTPQGPLEFSPEGIAITNSYIVEVKKKDGKYYFDLIRTYQKVMDPGVKK